MAGEKVVVETVAEKATDIVVKRILGDLVMPEEAKQQYVSLDNKSDQLVIDQYAYPFDTTQIPVD